MKSTNGKLLGFATATLMLFAACQKKQNEPAFKSPSNQDQPGTIVDGNNTVSMSAWFPVGTTFKETPGGVNATPPEGWSYIGTTTAGKGIYLQQKATSSITCTCNMGIGSCKPFQSSGPWGVTKGCTGTCTNCTMSQNVIQDNPYEMANGGYFQLNAPSRLLKNGESIPSVFDELLILPEFQQRLKTFYDKVYGRLEIPKPIYGSDGSITAPEGYTLVGASIMGRGLAVIVPEEFAKRELGYAANPKASCKCSNKTGECTLKDKTILGMGSIWCDGSCNGCTLTTNSKVISPTDTYQVNIFSVNF